MLKKIQKFQDAIFLITQEKSCPMYNIGEEIKIANSGLSVAGHKPGCLYLSKKVATISGSKESIGGIPKITRKNEVFNCGGCEAGIIHFEYKKDKDFATLQMKLLTESEEKRKKQHLEKFFHILRKLEIFEPLDNDALTDLTLLLDLKNIPVDKVVVKKGDSSFGLYIILKGIVSVLDDDGTKLAELGTGEIFGEMSLLSGEPAGNSVHTIEQSYIAILGTKNFKQVIVKHPVLQIFLFKLLVERAQTIALKSGDITSGMSGELDEVSVVDLLQLINGSRKTGTIDLHSPTIQAQIYFREGEIIDSVQNSKKGIVALYEILTIKTGHFTYTKGIPEHLSGHGPMGDFMALLMEGLQKIDEA